MRLFPTPPAKTVPRKLGDVPLGCQGRDAAYGVLGSDRRAKSYFKIIYIYIWFVDVCGITVLSRSQLEATTMSVRSGSFMLRWLDRAS